MSFILFVHLCSFVNGVQTPTCQPTHTAFPDLKSCMQRAKFYNEDFKVLKVFNGDKPKNGIAMTEPAKCLSAKSE